MRTLSKSDFKVAQDSPSKLYYRKRKFPSTMDENEYLKMLAEGGYAVGKLATLLYPEGVDLGGIGDPTEAVKRTNELLKQENVVLFEAAIRHGNFLVRVDVLVKKGKVLELIEVKSKSYDSDEPKIKNKSGQVGRTWKPYVEDVAYQTMVARLVFPELTVVPYLMLPDKARRTAIEGLNSQFEINELPPAAGSRFRGYDVQFTGDAEALRQDELLARVSMEEFIAPMFPTLANAATRYAESLNPELTRIAPELSVKCAKCEYRNATEDAEQDGFGLCWGARATVSPSVLDLYRAGNFKEGVNAFIDAGRMALAELPHEVLHNADGTPAYGGRPLMQLTKTTEWISDDLTREVRNWQYPLHFIDFETSTMALPYHAGMRPYEVVAFQWSCHTVRQPGAEPEHHEWINTLDAFPNFDFARSLMQHVGRKGTALMWATHENTTLRAIHEQMARYGHHDPELADWLVEVVKFDKKDQGWFTDMNALAVQGYFHPSTRGRTSIKFTLPAVLNSHRSKRIPQWLQGFEPDVDLLGKDEHGLINPYKLLPAIQLIDQYGTDEEEDEYTVNEGTGAMRAYQDMLYGIAKNDPEKKKKLREALRIYCKLDTLAMVVIWEHWR